MYIGLFLFNRTKGSCEIEIFLSTVDVFNTNKSSFKIARWFISFAFLASEIAPFGGRFVAGARLFLKS